MSAQKNKPFTGRLRRHRRIRSRAVGSAARPRLAVFRSAKHIVVQLIDDQAQRTILSASDRDIHEVALAKNETRAMAVARAVGTLVGERAKVAGVTSVVFDRGGFAYHGRVKALAEAARQAGLKF